MYDYQTEKPELLTEHGQDMLLTFHATVLDVFRNRETVSMGELLKAAKTSGSTWTQVAYVDYLKEKRVIREISGDNVIGQHRIFIKA